MDVFLLTSEGSSDGWGKPMQVFSSEELAIKYCVKEVIDFVRRDKCEVIENSIKINTRAEKNSKYISISIEGKDKEENYNRRFGLDRYLYKMKLQGVKNDRAKD